MLNLIRTIKQSEFIKNLATLISGTALAQLVAIGAQPVIRRLYTPEDFGAFAVYLSIVGVFVSMASLRYEQSIVLPKEEDDAKYLVVLSFIINISIFFIISLLVLILINFIIKLFDFPTNYKTWLYLLPFTVILMGFYQVINYWLIRKKAFKASSFNKLNRRVSEAVFQSGFGFFNRSFGLIIGDLLGNLANIISGFYQIKKYGFSFTKINAKELIRVAKRYSDFPKYNLLPVLLNTVSFAIPIFVINKNFSKELTGYYDLTKQVLALPLALITISFSQVLYQHISEKRNAGKQIFKILYKQFASLLVLVAFGVAIILLWGPDIFSFVFGKQWEFSGLISQILVFSFAIKFLVSPFSNTLIALEKIKTVAIWQISYFAILISLFFISDIGIINFLKIIVLIDLVCYSVYLLIIGITSYKYDKSLN